MFNERIKSLRTSLGLNQVEFGKKINVTKQSVCNWENGNILPSIEMLKKISNEFSVSTDYLLDYQAGRTSSHIEDELLRVFRSMTSEQQVIYVEQGKAVARLNQKEQAKSS